MTLDNPIEKRAYQFALRIVNAYKYLTRQQSEFVLSKQMLRSGTSIGAMMREAKFAQSRADFVSKTSIALKEANETLYWIELLHDSEYIDSKTFESIHNEANEITSILASIVKTTKENSEKYYTAQDFKKGQPRWCPGCGDHFFLASLHKAMAEIGVAPENVAVISGIGCSSRLPHYMATYGMNTIHGRAAAIATGAKIANPNLTVWQVSGDGDGLAIGGNHFIHANRRNIDLNMILLNNRIYGLTKGQYSPTSPRGFVSKSSPYGTVEDPFRPAELCFGARGHFFARCVATDAKGTVEVLKAAYEHKGASVTEVLQNCVIFNDHCHDVVYNNEGRKKNAIYVKHGEKLVFGENNEFGLVQQGFGLKVVEIGKDGYTIDDVLVHDAHCEDNTLQLKLALMGNNDGFPIALGVIRDVEAPTYNESVYAQLEEVSSQKKYHNFEELLETNDIWTVE